MFRLMLIVLLLASCYQSDVDVLREYAEKGDVAAQFNLGVMYASGEGLPKDYIKAYAWSSIAAMQGIDRAQRVKEFVAQDMTHNQIYKAQNLSRKYWEDYVLQR